MTALSGIRIWLSGSVPEDPTTTPEERKRLAQFTRHLTGQAFAEGATLLYGFRPSLTPVLLEAAQTYRERTSKRARFICSPRSTFATT